MCANGPVRFARYCGKMYSRHVFPYGGLVPFCTEPVIFTIHGVTLNGYEKEILWIPLYTAS